MDAAELQFIIKAQDQASAQIAAVSSTFADMGEIIKSQVAAMNELTSALNAATGKSKEAAAATHAHAEAHKHAGESAKEHEEAELGVGRALERVAKQAKEAAEALLGMWASNEMVRATVEAAEDTEHAIMAISRSAGVAKSEAKELHEALANISMRDGDATIEQFDKMAIAAARMGANVEQAQAFAVAISRITNAGNFQQVTEGVSQILQSTEEGVEGVDKFTDALAAMEKHALHGVEGLIPLISRLAAKSGELGISSSHLAAYAATFEKLGGRPEMQVMAFEGAVTKLKSVAEMGGRQLQDLAKQTHMSADAFSKLAEDHPEEAYIKLLEVVRSLQQQGADPKDFLSRIGIGAEQASGLESMAKHIATLKKNLADVDNSAGQGKAMEKDTRTDFDKALAEMTTAWTEFKAQIGASEMAPLVTSFKALVGIMQEFGLVLGGMSPELRGLILTFVIGMPAVLGLVKAFGAVKEMLSGIDEYFIRTGKTVKESSETMTNSVVKAEAETTAAVETGEAAKVNAVEAGEAKQVAAVETGGNKMVSATRLAAGRMSKELSLLGVNSVAGVLQGIAAVGFTIEALSNAAEFDAQQAAMTKNGITWYQEYLALKAMVGLGSEDDVRANIQKGVNARRKAGTENEGDKALDKKAEEKAAEAQKEAKAKEDDVSDPSINANVKAYKELNESVRAALESLDAYGKKNDEFAKQDEAIAKAKKLLADGGDVGYTAKQLDLMQQAVNAARLMADPLQAQARAMGDATAKAAAFTKNQQDALEVAIKIRDLEDKGVLDKTTPDDDAHQGVRSGMEAVQGAARTKSFQEQLIALNNQLALAGALTKADKDRLQIDQQIAQLQKTMGLDDGQANQLRTILELTKQIEDRTAQFKSLNPQANAIKDYREQLELLDKSRATMGEAEYAREKAKLDQDTLAQRDPLGNIAQQNQEELAQLATVGRYRDADLKTLQEITALQKNGVTLTKDQTDAMSASNRDLQDIKDMQQQLDGLTQSFGSGLSDAISQALAGQKYAFQHFALGLGKKMMDSAFTELTKGLQGELTGPGGPLSWLFGKAGKDADKLKGQGKDQGEQTMRVAQATIHANSVTVEGAIQASKDATDAATAAGAGATPNGTLQLPGIGSDAAIASRAGADSGSAGDFYAAARMHETGDRNIANASDGSAKGYYQFMPKTWSGIRNQNPGLNLPGDVLSASKDQQTAAYQAFTKGNVDQLQKSGVAINDKNVFMSSFLGAGGAADFIKDRQANPNAGAASLFPKAAGQNRTVFYNKDGSEKSLDQVYGNMTHSFGSGNTTGFGPGSSAAGSAEQAKAQATTNLQAAREAQQQYQEAAKAGAASLKTEITKVTPDIGKDLVDSAKKAQDQAVSTVPATPSPALSNSSPVSGVDASPAGAINSNSAAAAQLGSGIAGLGEKGLAMADPAAAPYLQGFNFLKSLAGQLPGAGASAAGAAAGAATGAADAAAGAAGAAAGGSGGIASLLGSLFAAFHTGGVVGRPTSLSRYVNPAIFAGAQRFHDGLGDDEFPAVLQRGERVLTANQDQRATAMMSRMADLIANSNASSPAGTQRPNSGRESGGRNVTMIVNTPNASSFRHSQSQIMASQHAQLQRSGAKHN